MSEPAMNLVFTRPESLKPAETHYCPGCGHSIAHRLVAECLDELNLREKTIGVPPVGLRGAWPINYFNLDMVEAAHGRPAGRGHRHEKSASRISSFSLIKVTVIWLRHRYGRNHPRRQPGRVFLHHFHQ